MKFAALTMALLMIVAGCDSPSYRPAKVPVYHGAVRETVLIELGPPDYSDKFPMSDALDEFRIELQNVYPVSDPANADVMIEEVRWKEGDYWLTLWLHEVNGEWVVLDSCRWHKDIQF